MTSIPATSGLSSIIPFNSIQFNSQTGSSTPASSTGLLNGSATDSANISAVGQFFLQLQQLQNTNPQQFKQVVSQIATQLQTEAQQLGQGQQSQFLQDLANKFQNVANGGSISQLQPQQHHGHHGHHHSKAAQAYSQTQQSSQPSLLSALGQTQQSSQQTLLSALGSK